MTDATDAVTVEIAPNDKYDAVIRGYHSGDGPAFTGGDGVDEDTYEAATTYANFLEGAATAPDHWDLEDADDVKRVGADTRSTAAPDEWEDGVDGSGAAEALVESALDFFGYEVEPAIEEPPDDVDAVWASAAAFEASHCADAAEPEVVADILAGKIHTDAYGGPFDRVEASGPYVTFHTDDGTDAAESDDTAPERPEHAPADGTGVPDAVKPDPEDVPTITWSDIGVADDPDLVSIVATYFDGVDPTEPTDLIRAKLRLLPADVYVDAQIAARAEQRNA